jgi:hybrid cluster-associated redox disulfide protein
MAELTRTMLVDHVMRQWPASIRVFIDFGMKCVGCPFGTFHSIANACDEHEASLDAFLEALESAIADTEVKLDA